METLEKTATKKQVENQPEEKESTDDDKKEQSPSKRQKIASWFIAKDCRTFPLACV